MNGDDYLGTTWVCRQAVCLVVRDLGRSVDGTSYMKVLLLQHDNPGTAGEVLVATDVEKWWRPL